MSPEERDRLTRLEVEFENQKSDLAEIKANLNKLLTAAAMGKGAWWLLLKIGGIGLLVAGAFAWIWDHIPHK